MPATDWISTGQAAARLGVGRSTIRRWIEEGHLPAKRVGARRHWRINRADLDNVTTDEQQVAS